MQAQSIKIYLLVSNTGQIPGLPKNPRLIKDEKYLKLIQSLKDDPEMLELRELIVFPFEGKYVVIAGNMRLKAMSELKYTDAPCKVLDAGTPVEKLKAYTIKDNIGYGDHAWDELQAEWDVEQLEEWGLDIPKFVGIEEGTDGFTLPDGDKAPFQQMTFTLADEQAVIIKNAIDEIKGTDEYKYAETMGNENSNGNALYLIVASWAGQRKY